MKAIVTTASRSKIEFDHVLSKNIFIALANKKRLEKNNIYYPPTAILEIQFKE